MSRSTTDISVAAATAFAMTVAAGCLFLKLARHPESQIFGRTIVAGNDSNEFCLTFDDGPTESATLPLLEVLAKHAVRATFFMVGRNVKRSPKVARAVLDAGHLIGNHTMNHAKLTRCSPVEIRTELSDCSRIIEDTLGLEVRYFRPPHGMRNPAVLRTASDLGLLPVMWNVSSNDWSPIGSEAIWQSTAREIAHNRRKGRGSNILLHDCEQSARARETASTAVATDALLKGYAADSLVRFVTPEVWS